MCVSGQALGRHVYKHCTGFLHGVRFYHEVIIGLELRDQSKIKPNSPVEFSAHSLTALFYINVKKHRRS